MGEPDMAFSPRWEQLSPLPFSRMSAPLSFPETWPNACPSGSVTTYGPVEGRRSWGGGSSLHAHPHWDNILIMAQPYRLPAHKPWQLSFSNAWVVLHNSTTRDLQEVMTEAVHSTNDGDKHQQNNNILLLWLRHKILQGCQMKLALLKFQDI